jgi:hypothetical protein
MSAVMPGSWLQLITHLARREISRLHSDDFAIIWEVQMTLTEMNPTLVSDTTGISQSKTNIQTSLK